MEALYTDSEWESYSENSDDEARYGNDSMFGNHARSILSSLDASIRKIDDFLHLDRSFGVGDSVCLNSDRTGQIGRVVKVHMIVDLENSFGQTIQNVEGKKIIRISPFANGDYVVNGLWLGKIDKVFDAVSVLFDDGLKCMINGEDLENANEDVPFPHFPGQRVRMKRSTMFDSARKFCGGWDEGTICQVEVRSVQVNWISPIINHSSIPCSLQDPKDLTPLLCHIHNSWQIGDWCKFQNPQEMIAKIEMRSTVIDCSYVITKIKTKLEVLWQEGQLAENVDPGDLLPVNVVDHDFWPGDIVQKKALNEDTAPSESQHFGVVKFVNAKERMVKVNWISGLENSVEETVSAYELVEHPDYNYRVGEIVLRQPDNQVHDNSEHLSCIGCVVESRDGEVKVRWAHGVQSQVNCTEIYGLDRIPAPSATPPENSDERDLFVTRQKGFWNVELDSLPQAVSGFFTNVITSLFGQQNSYALSSTNDSEPINDSHGQSLVPLSSFTNRLNTDLTTRDKIVCESNQESEPKIEMVKQFDFSDDYSDHHYIDGCLSGHSKVGRVWSKKIQQEWKILEENLPDTIYVQVYEQRMDLIRAVIIGASGTPYQYGLFFFDLYLPPAYPHVPPEVHYHSGGLRLNPNLYESGKVCLSLLKTWSGTESEEWDPQKSTILQLLLSLQALVLNDRPYFNEAGYERQVGSVDGERNAITYNENAFLLSCRSMLYLMKKPPKGFEEFVGGHFRRQAESILSACDAYKSGSAWLTGSTELSCSTGFKIMLEKLLPRLQEGFAELERSQG